MSVNELAAWQGFFGVIAQTGATLAGLLFVGLTISLQHVLAAHGYLARAFSALFLQLQILVIGIFGALPGQPAWLLGIEFIVTGTALCLGIFAFVRNFPEDDKSNVLGSAGLRRFRTVLTATATLLPVASGIALILGWRYAFYLLVPAIIACVYQAIGYAWVFAVEIPRQVEEGRSK